MCCIVGLSHNRRLSISASVIQTTRHVTIPVTGSGAFMHRTPLLEVWHGDGALLVIKKPLGSRVRGSRVVDCGPRLKILLIQEQLKGSEMGKMMRGAGVWGLGIVLLVLVASPAGSEAIWSGKKNSEAATAAEAAKEYAKEAARNTADAAANVGESIKQTANAAYETTANVAKTVTGGRSDRGYGAPTGAAYRDRAGNYVADTAAGTQRIAADAAGAVKDTAVNTAQAARDTASRAYDASADTLGSVRDKVWGAPEPEPSYTQRAADAARWASQNVRDSASRAYDTTADTVTAPFVREDNRGVYEKARDTTYRTMGYEAPSDRSYASRAYDSARDTSSDAYEAGKNKLGSIIEILGWHRAPEEDSSSVTSTLGKYSSPYDVMVGNTRYVWHKRDEKPESYYQSAKAAAGSATQTVAEKANQAASTVYDAAGRTKDATVETASRAKDATVQTASRASDSVSRASDSVKDVAGEYGQKGKEVLSAGAAAVGADKLVKDGFFRRLWRFVHLLTWGVAFGTAVWMTFMSGRVLQQNMPREQFRTVQTKMFPSYLRFLTAGEGALAFLYTFLSRSSWWQTLVLLALVGATAYNAYVLEPQTTKLYLDRLRLEKEEGKGLNPVENVNTELDEKNKKFKELHGYSASLNLLSLAGLTYHAWNMVSRLYA